MILVDYDLYPSIEASIGKYIKVWMTEGYFAATACRSRIQARRRSCVGFMKQLHVAAWCCRHLYLSADSMNGLTTFSRGFRVTVTICMPGPQRPWKTRTGDGKFMNTHTILAGDWVVPPREMWAGLAA